MLVQIILHRIIVPFDGITINTTIQATLISTDVNTLRTPANITLIFIFPDGYRITCNSFHQLIINAQSTRNAQVSQIDLDCTCIQLNRTGIHRFFKGYRHLLNIRFQ